MKKTFALCLLTVALVLCQCGQKKADEDPNKALYNRVMDIHDEVMPNMGELNRLKRELTRKIENSPDLVEGKRREIEETILLVDSASRAMMVWMREFNPEDYSDKEELKDYLKSEMKRMQEVKDLMLDALEKGRKANE
jgi:hypothetical protein